MKDKSESLNLAAMIERGNACIAINKLEERVVKLRKDIEKDLRSRYRGPAKVKGRTVRRVWESYNKLAMLFVDGTYLAFEMTQDYDEPSVASTVCLTCEEGIEAGLVAASVAQTLHEAERAWQAHLDVEIAKQQLHQAVEILGAEKVGEIVKRRQRYSNSEVQE